MASSDSKLFESITKNEKVTIPEVANLEKLILEDNVPHLQFDPQCLEINLASSVNPLGYVDNKGYITPYNEESELAGSFEATVEHGTSLVNFLYTYRSISKALPEYVSGYIIIATLKNRYFRINVFIY